MRKTESRSGVDVAKSSPTVQCPTSRYRHQHRNLACCDQNKLIMGNTEIQERQTERAETVKARE